MRGHLHSFVRIILWHHTLIQCRKKFEEQNAVSPLLSVPPVVEMSPHYVLAYCKFKAKYNKLNMDLQIIEMVYFTDFFHLIFLGFYQYSTKIHLIAIHLDFTRCQDPACIHELSK